VHHMRIKYIALVFVACYLLSGFSLMATGLCSAAAEQCRAGRILTNECCAGIVESSLAKRQPCGACFDNCDLGKHPSFNIFSPLLVKRLAKTQSAAVPTSSVAPCSLTVWHSTPLSQPQTGPPNPILAVLRTVVLLI